MSENTETHVITELPAVETPNKFRKFVKPAAFAAGVATAAVIVWAIKAKSGDDVTIDTPDWNPPTDEN